MSLGKIEHSLLHDHDVMKKPGFLRPDGIKQLRALNERSSIFRVIHPFARNAFDTP